MKLVVSDASPIRYLGPRGGLPVLEVKSGSITHNPWRATPSSAVSPSTTASSTPAALLVSAPLIAPKASTAWPSSSSASNPGTNSTPPIRSASLWAPAEPGCYLLSSARSFQPHQVQLEVPIVAANDAGESVLGIS
jgi:hypothetical protein